MNPSRRALLASFSLVAALAPALVRGHESCSDPALADRFACRQIVVEYDPARFDAAAMAARYGLELVGDLPQLERAWYLTPPGSVEALIERIRDDHDPAVRDVEVNQEIVSPECVQWAIGVIELGNDPWQRLRDQPALRAMHVAATASPVALPGRGVTVAVVDTGVSRRHPMLQGHLTARGIDRIGGSDLADDLGNGIDDDHDGVVDRGYGHGTAVAGLIALVAPGAHILPVRGLDDECKGTAFSMAAGIVAAVDAGASVINASIGSIEESRTISRAVQYARDHGAVVIAPAGNHGGDHLQFPAERSDVYAVAAVDALLVAPAFTAHSSNVELSAPGVDLDVPYREGYARVSGTSFATALVSGSFAVGIGLAPQLDRRKVLDVLQETASPVDPFNHDLRGELGDGVPDLAAAAAAFRASRRGRELRLPGGTGATVSFPGGTPVILSRD